MSYEDSPQDPIDEPADKGGPPDHADPQGKPHAATTTTTAAPPTGIDPHSTPGDPARQGRDVLIGNALQYSSSSSLSGADPGVRTLPGDREPLTDVSGTFERPGHSARSGFVPTAIFAALLAWATITGFERRRRDLIPTDR